MNPSIRRHRPPRGPARGWLLAAIGVPLLLAARPASAQDALGTGRSLDANLSPSTGQANPRVGRENFRARNLIITDNVVGGRGFRETVGYSAPDTFRGEVGSDDLFRFRADSAWSNVNFVNFGNTYQRLRFGQDLGVISYERFGMGTSAGAISGRSMYAPMDLMQARLRADRLSLASSVSAALESSREPVILGGTVDREGARSLIRTSSLGGLTETPLSQAGQLLGFTTYDIASFRGEILSGALNPEQDRRMGDAFRSSYADLTRVDSRVTGHRREIDPERLLVEPSPPDRRGDDIELALAGREEILRVQLSVADRFAALAGEDPTTTGDGRPRVLDNEILAELEEDLRRLKERLAGHGGDAEGPAGDGEGFPPGADRRGLDVDGFPRNELRAEPFTVRDPLPKTLDEYGIILRHGERIDQLASDEPTRFNELLTAGEKALTEGRYFWAERRFNRALRFVPGHPLPTAGLAHSQIGAGLYQSAALTLRSLFSFQPEMIDVRYGPDLLPKRTRLLEAIATLDVRLQTVRDRNLFAFLLAYVGRLVDDRAALERGLAIMAADAPDDPLLPLLQSIWLGSDEGAGEHWPKSRRTTPPRP